MGGNLPAEVNIPMDGNITAHYSSKTECENHLISVISNGTSSSLVSMERTILSDKLYLTNRDKDIFMYCEKITLKEFPDLDYYK
tara:strand:- start:1599 stop:1850 length:252 start_codon:yes stop_codon:yes gene_type:complete